MDDKTRAAFGVVSEVNRLLESTPGAAAILDALRTGSIDPMEAMTKLAALALEAGHGESLVQASSKLTDTFNITVQGTDNPDGIPILMKHDNGMAMLNPLMEAALSERAALDGDVPEARVGPIPEGGYPAVPVLTDSHDPVIIGMQLERASREVKGEIKQAIKEHAQLCLRIVDKVEEETEGKEDSYRKTALEITQKNLPPVPVGVPKYMAGQKAALRKVSINPASALTLNKEQRSRYVYAVLGTTQGRVSVAPVVQKGVIELLRARGVNAVAAEPYAATAVTTQWVMEVWGAEDLGADFNPISLAIHSMCEDIYQFIQDHSEVCVRVGPYHGIADRRFGWVLVAGPRRKS